MEKESVDFYVLEVARLDGAKNENVRGMAEPEINMADENPRVSGTK